MLVQNGWQAPACRRETPEGRGSIPVQMHDVGLLPVEFAQQVQQRRRIELRLGQIGDVDPPRFQRVLGRIRLAKTDQRYVEMIPIKAGNHPGEQTLHTVHPRAWPAQVVADLDDVQRAAHSSPCSLYHAAVFEIPLARSTLGSQPISVRARVVSNARLFVKNSTRRR